MNDLLKKEYVVRCEERQAAFTAFKKAVLAAKTSQQLQEATTRISRLYTAHDVVHTLVKIGVGFDDELERISTAKYELQRWLRLIQLSQSLVSTALCRVSSCQSTTRRNEKRCKS